MSEIAIYNPKDSLRKPYFLFADWPYINPECALSEEEYEKLCDIKWINPIYPMTQKKKAKKIALDIYERIKKRRMELWITM